MHVRARVCVSQLASADRLTGSSARASNARARARFAPRARFALVFALHRTLR